MIIGIDLGTTNSCAAYVKDGKAQVIKNAEGECTTPSVVTFKKDGTSYIGKDAKNRKTIDPQDTIWSYKRFMGRPYSLVKKEFDSMPYLFTCDQEDNICVYVAGRRMTVSEIASRILTKVRLDSQEALKKTINSAVITVPAYFTDSQREATREAGILAGLDVKRIISEPTAAALAFCAQTPFEGTMAVYDLGGGTFDISILEAKNNSFKVLSTAGDTILGGDDIDKRVSSWLLKEVRAKLGYDLQAEYDNPVTRTVTTLAMQKIRVWAERAKIEMTGQEYVDIEIPDLCHGQGLKTRLTKANLESMMSFVVDKTLKLCQKALDDAKLKNVDKVILVGGSTKSPFVQEKVSTFFKSYVDTSLDPDQAVALGAAIMAKDIEDNNAKLIDVIPLNLGILCQQKDSRKRETAVIIPANTTIPAQRTMRFTTAKDRQEAIDLCIMQGPSVMGNMRIDLMPMPKGKPRVSVTFSVDGNGILSISAVDDNGSVKNATLKKRAI